MQLSAYLCGLLSSLFSSTSLLLLNSCPSLKGSINHLFSHFMKVTKKKRIVTLLLLFSLIFLWSLMYGLPMFSPSSSNNYNHLKVKVRHHSPALNNLFYSEDRILIFLIFLLWSRFFYVDFLVASPSPPSFNLDGIDGDFLATNHDSELTTSPPHSPITIEATASSVPWNKSATSPSQSPTSQTPSFPLPRSRSTSPQQQDPDAPSRGKGTHKSIFSVFATEETYVLYTL